MNLREEREKELFEAVKDRLDVKEDVLKRTLHILTDEAFDELYDKHCKNDFIN